MTLAHKHTRIKDAPLPEAILLSREPLYFPTLLPTYLFRPMPVGTSDLHPLLRRESDRAKNPQTETLFG